MSNRLCYNSIRSLCILFRIVSNANPASAGLIFDVFTLLLYLSTATQTKLAFKLIISLVPVQSVYAQWSSNNIVVFRHV